MKCGFCRTLGIKFEASMIKANASAWAVGVQGGSSSRLCQGLKTGHCLHKALSTTVHKYVGVQLGVASYLYAFS